MRNSVEEIYIKNEDVNIFSRGEKYIIPLYQRAYSWGYKQIGQLIEDIANAPGEHYYIGTLIVSKQSKGSKEYEVIDGQQRLTSLYLLLNCLGLETDPALTFECRDRSNYTIENIKGVIKDVREDNGKFDKDKIDKDKIDLSIHSGVKIISKELEREGFDKDDFIKKLSRMIVFRIEVPEHTDLNRYFEIMNTRGEQLEQHDILKAKLMSYLKNDTDKEIFAEIWDACSDMTGYVQMHFKSTAREKIFGGEWNKMPPNKWGDYREIYSEIDENNKPEGACGYDIYELINKDDIKTEGVDGYEDDGWVRFESIIEFTYFLLHTLKVYVNTDDVTLYDKKLLSAFKKVVSKVISKDVSKEEFARNFIMCLLRTRYLFDSYIIKREIVSESDSSGGEWSLKSLAVSKENTKKNIYYKNSKFVDDDKKNYKIVKESIMIQSALRVSYHSPRSMHWVTKLLKWLYKEDLEEERKAMTKFNEIAEDIAKDAVRENFFDICGDGKYEMGERTPRIVFNYLDFILWRDEQAKYKDFSFEFRDSVEHWYPRNPSEGSFERWEDGVDRFGNLCILQSNLNAKFSNLSPDAKKSEYYQDKISKGSIKLRKMSESTSTGKDWKDNACAEHEKEMIDKLKEACGLK